MERILCATIWYKEIILKTIIPQVLPVNITEGLVVCGYRHGHIIWTVKGLAGFRTVQFAEDGVGAFEQGFITSHNRFVTRVEAMKIAKSAQQISLNLKDNKLYSEDLY